VRDFLPFEFSVSMLRDENSHHQGFSISLSKHWKEIWSSDRASNLVVSGEKKNLAWTGRRKKIVGSRAGFKVRSGGRGELKVQFA